MIDLIKQCHDNMEATKAHKVVIPMTREQMIDEAVRRFFGIEGDRIANERFATWKRKYHQRGWRKHGWNRIRFGVVGHLRGRRFGPYIARRINHYFECVQREQNNGRLLKK